MANGVWFRLNVGRERNADPKWLLPEICRQGEVTKKDVGAIRVFETETLFQVAPDVLERFSALVTERKKGGVRILPARDQTGESFARPDTGEKQPHPEQPHTSEKPDFNKKKFGQKRFGKQKFGKRPHKDHKPPRT
jgi:ATP-dependent RNA helicase DeaD